MKGERNSMNKRNRNIVIAVILLLLACCLASAAGIAIRKYWWPVTSAPAEIPAEGEAEKEVVVEKPVIQTVVEKPIKAEPLGTGCRSLVWWDNAINDTGDVASLISLLDRDFKPEDGGQWSEPGYTVPGGSVLWTDLFENRPIAQAVQTQGGWGVYYTENDLIVPPPNGGGRWMRLCAPLEIVEAEVPPEEQTTTCAIPDLNGLTVADAINVMDLWFEETGWSIGDSFAVGDLLPSGSVFWTNLGLAENAPLPTGITGINHEGGWGVFQTNAPYGAPSAGRYVQCDL